ncbi:anti-sigma factor [Patescibacteria group bacterium]
MAEQISKPNVQNLLIGAGVILLVIAGFFYFRSKGANDEKTSLNPEEIIVQEEGIVKRTGDIIQPLTEEERKQLQEEVDGVLSASGDMLTLMDSSAGGASGEAKRAFSDGKFYFKLTASGLSSVEKGYYYESWLEKDEKNISTGRVEVDSMGNGELYYTVSVDRSEYPKVFVSIEPEDGNPAPADKILEGEF